MSLRRFFLEASSFDHEYIHLRSHQFYHAFHVLRLKKGDLVEGIDGVGSIYRCRIEEISSTEARCVVLKRTESFLEQKYIWSCALALPKEKVMRFVLEKSTELGVKSIFPYISARSQGRPQLSDLEKRKNRWNRIIQGALQQSGNPLAPQLFSIFSFKDWLSFLSKTDFDEFVLLSPWASRSFSDFDDRMRKSSKTRKILFCLGPEGGLTREEEEEILSRSNGKRYHCGPLLMRVETAFMFVSSACKLLNLKGALSQI